MIKLNFKKIQALENEYNAKGHSISQNTLQSMIDIVMTQSVDDSTYSLANNTLMELGVLESFEPAKKSEQLNS